jgi:RNA polymerase sigma-70 factor (ECF subfamily)
MTTPPDDTALLLAAGRGDRSAFGELVERRQRAVVRFVHRFLGTADRATAEDIAQDVFLAAWKAAPTFRPRAAVLTWLLRIATNSCLNYQRSRRRKPTVSLDSVASPTVAPHEGGRDDGTAELDERSERIRAAVAQLPTQQRAALILRHFQELSYAEIAGVLGSSVSSVESLLFRARSRLRALLDESPETNAPS